MVLVKLLLLLMMLVVGRGETVLDHLEMGARWLEKGRLGEPRCLII